MTTPKQAPLDKLKAQLVQLDQLIAEGVLTGDTARQSRQDLEQQILKLVLGQASPGSEGAATAQAIGTALGTAPGPAPDAPAPARAPRKLVVGTAAFVLVFGLVGYGFMGNRAGWQVGPGERGEGAAAAAAATPAEQQAQVQAMVAKLEERLKAQPDDVEGWQMMARSYNVMGRYADAVKAYQRLVALRPQDAQALADLADATAMANGRTLEGEPEKLILQAVKLDPRNVKALALAGTVAFNRSDFKAAVGYWEQAVALADPATGYAQQLAGVLAEARQQAGLPPAPAAKPGAGAPVDTVAAATRPAAAAETPASAQAAAIRGRVVLRAGLKDKVGPDDTVFIFARAPSGSRMPLAILKKKVSDLPLDFTLDDSLAMSPAARLSSAQQVVVGARISRSGNAAPGPGDLQALSAPVGVNATGVTLEIGDPVQ
jgi:cytochrome c-type biogenesis protein CcmH